MDGSCQPCTAETCPLTACDGGACQSPVTCSNLPTPCVAGQTCIEATSTADAYCATQSCPACTGTGVVEGPGIKLSSGSCICPTQPGYFFSESGSRTAVPCDADGDGWVRSAARFYLNHADPTLRENARCELRVVNQFVLHNDLGETVEAALGVPLPLYESVRNDDAFVLQDATGTPQLPRYGTVRALHTAELNSLTKACVGERADHNDNRVSDIAEWGRPPDQQSPLGSSSDLEGEMRGYFEVYTRYSYFLELHRGWYTPGEGGNPGSYHIQEKDRTLPTGTNFPLRYGFEPQESTEAPVRTSNYWQDCRRARDSWYSVEKPPVGMDFASLSGPNPIWKGMTHHSQFKCVQVVDEVRFGTTDRELNRHLQAVKTLKAPTDTTPQAGCEGQTNCVCRASEDKCNAGLSCENSAFTPAGVCRVPSKDHLRATINLCGLDAAEGTVIPGHGANPADPSFSCEVSLPSAEHEGAVVWAAVRLTESSQYARGCILQCAGHPFICPGGTSNSCQSICGDFMANEPSLLGGGAQDLSLVGEVPVLPRTPKPMSGGRFQILPR